MKTNRYLELYKQEGFSIIEILVVLVILAILAGVAIPVYIGMKPSIRLSGATRQIMGDLMWARMRAVSENNDYVITFGSAGPDLSNNTYAIYDDNDGDFDSAGVETSELIKSVVIPGTYKQAGYGYVPGIKKTDNVTPLTGDPVTFSSGGVSKPIWFKFYPTGRSNISGTIYIISDVDLSNNYKGRMRAISVLSFTGKIKIWHYDQETVEWK